MLETVQDYHMFWGVRTRTLVQQIHYAMADLPGDRLVLLKARTDISMRLERDFIKIGSRIAMLQYELPLDEDHLELNPPMRRVYPKTTIEKSTQTKGTFRSEPVTAIIMD